MGLTPIYSTLFDPKTLKALSPGTNTGFFSLEEAIQAMGPPLKATKQWAIYGNENTKMMVSWLNFSPTVDAPVNSRYP